MDALWNGTGLRVVELGSGISASYGARLIGDFGGDIIKVEAPGAGDSTRALGPFPGDREDPEASGTYLYLNANKRGITLDPSSYAGKSILADLLGEADLVIENLGPGAFDALDLSLPQRLVVCSISWYGQDGPRAHERSSGTGAYATAAIMHVTGEAEREPIAHGEPQGEFLAGVHAASASLAATMLARRTGVGQRIDVSVQEVLAQAVFPALNLYSHTGAHMRRSPRDRPRLVASSPMEAADGYIMPSYAGFTDWTTFAGFMGIEALNEERFQTREGRLRNAHDIDAIAEPKFRSMPKADVFHDGQAWGLTFTAIQTPEDIANCPHLEERGHFYEQDHPVAGRIRMPGMVPHTAIERHSVRSAPLLGQHTGEVLAALGQDSEAREALALAGVI